ncbi:MAG: hypothetical protein AAB071_03220 [Bacteroidota bacterium]
MNTRSLLLLLLFTLFVSNTLFAEKKTKERTDEKKFSVEAKGKIYVSSNLGDVHISAGSDNEVHIVVKIKGTEKKVDKFTTEMTQDGNTIKVKGDFDRNLLDKFKFGMFRSSSLDVQFNITVPSQFYSNINTAGGDISIKKINSKQEGSTSGGDVLIEECTGELWFKTSGGSMEVRNCNSNINMMTKGGDITIHNSVGDIDLQTSGGDITLDEVKGKINGETSGGEITCRALENQGIFLKTSGGGIRVKLPPGAKGNLDASTSFGEVNCSFPFDGTSKKTKMDGKFNGGGELVKLKTSGGDIKIDSF